MIVGEKYIHKEKQIIYLVLRNLDNKLICLQDEQGNLKIEEDHNEETPFLTYLTQKYEILR